MPVVCHLIRRYLHYTATFVGNQLQFHERYTPVVIYRQHLPGSMHHSTITTFSLNCRSGFKAQLENLWYTSLRQLSPGQNNKIVQLLGTIKPDILHFHYGTDAGMYRQVLKKSLLPKIVSFYGWDYSSFPKQYAGLGKMYLQKWVFPYADIILAMSHDMQTHLQQLGCPPEKIRVHYHGINTHLFPAKQDYSISQPIQISLLGSLEPKKGHLVLLKALELASERGLNDFCLHITDSGRSKTDIQAYLNQSKLSEKVIMHPAYPYGSQTHLHLLRNTDIYVQPSITDSKGNKEGIPGTLIEAMSSGLPVIASHHAGIPEVIQHQKNGLLVAENRAEDLANQLVRLGQDPKLREQLGCAAAQYARQSLDIRQKEKELECLYDELRELKSSRKPAID